MAEWDELAGPWRECLELAWEAYRAGTVPVGAVVVSGAGEIVARGRNRILDADGGALAGSRLAHAEVEALARLRATARYRDHTLYSALEPCLLCTGAALISTVGRIAYLACDPYGGGCSGAIDTPHWNRRRLEIDGPQPGWPSRLAAALQAAHWLGRTDEVAPTILEAFGEEACRAGGRLRALAEPPQRFEEALPRLLDCL